MWEVIIDLFQNMQFINNKDSYIRLRLSFSE